MKRKWLARQFGVRAPVLPIGLMVLAVRGRGVDMDAVRAPYGDERVQAARRDVYAILMAKRWRLSSIARWARRDPATVAHAIGESARAKRLRDGGGW